MGEGEGKKRGRGEDMHVHGIDDACPVRKAGKGRERERRKRRRQKQRGEKRQQNRSDENHSKEKARTQTHPPLSIYSNFPLRLLTNPLFLLPKSTWLFAASWTDLPSLEVVAEVFRIELTDAPDPPRDVPIAF